MTEPTDSRDSERGLHHYTADELVLVIGGLIDEVGDLRADVDRLTDLVAGIFRGHEAALAARR